MLTRLPKISIIVPCYNHEEHIEECLESIKKQSVEDYEVIIINDCSKDATGEVIKDFMNRCRDTRFHYYENEKNLGATKNFNKGLSLAKSEYLAFIAGDDYWDPNFIEVLIGSILDKNLEYAFCQTVAVNNLNEYLAIIPPDELQINRSEDIYLNMLRGNIMGGHSIIFNHNILKKYGCFDESVSYFSDWDFFLRLSRNCKGTYIPKKLAYYRIHGSNLGIRQFMDDACFSDLKLIMERYILYDNDLLSQREIIFSSNLLNFAASCLYNHNYRLVKQVIAYGRKQLGIRILLNPHIGICYLLSLVGNNTLVNIVSKLRNKKVAHI